MSVHQRVIKKNFNRIFKIKSVASFPKDIQKVNRRTVAGIEFVQHLPYQSTQLL